MTLTEQDKKFLRELLKREIALFEKDKMKRPLVPQIIAVEEKYDEYLHKLLKKI